MVARVTMKFDARAAAGGGDLGGSRRSQAELPEQTPASFEDATVRRRPDRRRSLKRARFSARICAHFDLRRSGGDLRRWHFRASFSGARSAARLYSRRSGVLSSPAWRLHRWPEAARHGAWPRPSAASPEGDAFGISRSPYIATAERRLSGRYHPGRVDISSAVLKNASFEDLLVDVLPRSAVRAFGRAREHRARGYRVADPKRHQKNDHLQA